MDQVLHKGLVLKGKQGARHSIKHVDYTPLQKGAVKKTCCWQVQTDHGTGCTVGTQGRPQTCLYGRMCLEILLEESTEKNISNGKRDILLKDSTQRLLSHLSRDFRRLQKGILRNVDFETRHTAKRRVYTAECTTDNFRELKSCLKSHLESPIK